MLAVFFASCSNVRYLQSGQVLLKKNTVDVQTELNLIQLKKSIEENLTLSQKISSLARQQPNNKTLQLVKLNLSFYNWFHTEKDSGFKRFMMTKIGEPPVLFDSTLLLSSSLLMNEYMQGKGYLLSDVTYDYHIKHKRATAEFTVVPGPLYTIDSVFFPPVTDGVTKNIADYKDSTMLISGNAFDRNVLQQEQLRMVRNLQNRGYFYYRTNDIYFDADTFGKDKKVNLYVRTDTSVSADEKAVYSVRNVFVYCNYDQQVDPDQITHDTIRLNNLFILDSHGIILPSVIAAAIFIQSAERYSKQNYNCTLTRLAALGIFKFISVRYHDAGNHQLDAFIYLTPGKKNEVTAEVEASTITENIGTGVKLSFRNKNVIQRADVFDINVNGGIQIPVLNRDSLLYNVTSQVNFYLPRFGFPFQKAVAHCYTSPQTKLSLSANFYQQTNVYTLTTYAGSYGFDWHETRAKRHVFNLLSVSLVKPSNLSLAFAERLNSDPFLKQSFSEQFITGLGYSFIFSNQNLNASKNFTFLRFTSEFSGTFLYLANKAITTTNVGADGKFELLGTDYSTFTRLEADVRHYFYFTQRRTLVLRASAGEAINYWNSGSIPFIKQFYLGGTSSMRAWRVRSLGPGSYEDTSATNFFSSAGDIKMEANIEYRFNIFARLKGALFTDAGNVWLRKYEAEKPGADFQFNRFYKEIAIGGGIGLRVDFTYFIVRLDVATPIRDPQYAEADRWVIGNFNLFNSDWRKQNLLLNLGIGYPF